MHCGALGHVQHPALYHSGVRRFSHFASERIKLENEMSLCRTSYTRIARHVPYTVKRQRYNDTAASEPCRSKPRFYAGMSSTYHNYVRIEFFVYFHCLFTHAESGEDVVQHFLRDIFSGQLCK